MTYEIYTFPNCNKCQSVKKILEGKEIKYYEINAGIGEGRVRFLEFYRKNKNSIERKDDQIILPILVNDSKILQGLERITEFINGN